MSKLKGFSAQKKPKPGTTKFGYAGDDGVLYDEHFDAMYENSFCNIPLFDEDGKLHAVYEHDDEESASVIPPARPPHRQGPPMNYLLREAKENQYLQHIRYLLRDTPRERMLRLYAIMNDEDNKMIPNELAHRYWKEFHNNRDAMSRRTAKAIETSSHNFTEDELFSAWLEYDRDMRGELT